MNAAAESFDSPEHRRATAELGMWVFLATEVMFFGPLLLTYGYGRYRYPLSFTLASQHTNVLVGSVNTAVLLTSSFFMALAARAATLRQARAASRLLLMTALAGIVFLVLKAIEYHEEWQEHLVPWLNFDFAASTRVGASLFYELYFALTGLHALHLTIGVAAVLTYVARLQRLRSIEPLQQVHILALYWHFVDAVWIFLYPMIYLVKRHG